MARKTVSVEIEGVADFVNECKKMSADGKKTLGALLLEAATATHKFAIDSIRNHKGSRQERRYRPRRDVIVSPEGEAPNSDIGTLVQNITLEKESNGYTVGSRKGAPHGFWLEEGTSTMGARPWLRPAFELAMKTIRGKYG